MTLNNKLTQIKQQTNTIRYYLNNTIIQTNNKNMKHYNTQKNKKTNTNYKILNVCPTYHNLHPTINNK